jgi:hypothetical protein
LTVSDFDYSEILKSAELWSVASRVFFDIENVNSAIFKGNDCVGFNTVYGFMTVHGHAMTIQEIDHAIDELGYKTPFEVLNAEIIKQKEGYTTTLEQHSDLGWWWNIRGNDGLIIVEGVTNSYQIAVSRINVILQVV